MDDVRRDDRLVCVLEDPGQRPGVGSGTNSGVDLVRRGLAADLDDEVDDGAVRDGRAHGHAVDLALQVGHHERRSRERRRSTSG